MGKRLDKVSYGQEIYAKIKKGVLFEPDLHCPRILDIFNEGGGVIDFCMEFGISKQMFNGWQQRDDRFKESVQIGFLNAMNKWLKDGEDNLGNKDFNTKVWLAVGRSKYRYYDKLYLRVNPKDNPMEQYRQILDQASSGELESGQIKQLMEAINIGLRAHEVVEIQKEVDELKEGLKKMEERELEHQIAVTPVKEEDKATVASKVRK